MSYLGDFYLGANIDTKFTTVNTSGVPTMLTGSPAIVAYPDNSTTEITAGLTLTTNFDGRSGLNHVRVVATGANGYATGTNYALVLSTGTVGGNFVGGYAVKEFSIEARAALRPSSDGRDIVLSPAGFVDVNDKTGFSLSSPQTFNLIGNITGTFVGNISGAVGQLQTNLDKLEYGLLNNQVINVSGTITNVYNVLNPVTVGTNNDKTGYGLATGTLLDAIADTIWDEQLGGHLTTGSAGRRLNDAASAGSDPWATSLPGLYSVGQAGYVVGTFVDTHISSRMPSGTVVVGDKTGYFLSSPQNFDWTGNHTGTWVGLHRGDTIGNTTGTWMGNISGTVGAVNGLVPSRLDVNVSSRMPSGTVLALVTGTVNSNVTQWLSTPVQSLSGDGFIKADLKSIEDELTNGNNATLKLKQLHVVNPDAPAIYAESSALGSHAIHAKNIATAGNGIFAEGANNGLYAYGDQVGMFSEGANYGGYFIGDNDTGLRVEAYGSNKNALDLFGAGTGKSVNAPNGIAVSDGDLTLTNIAKKILTLDWTTVTGEAARSVLNALRKLRNKVSFNGTDTLTVYKEDGTTSAYTQSVVEDTNQDPFKELGN